jgi:hypothetical protein
MSLETFNPLTMVRRKKMKLMTKEITTMARKQYEKGNDLESQKIVAKFFDPTGSWTWYLMNQDPEDPDHLWGIVKGFEVEIGSFNLSDLQSIKGRFGLGIERDLYFRPMPAKEVWEKLNAGQHI